MSAEVAGGEEAVRAQLEEVAGDAVTGLTRVAPRRLMGEMPPERVVEVLRTLRERLEWRHLSAISGGDAGDDLEVLYHVSAPHGVLVSLRARLPREDPVVDSVVEVYPVAAIFEREAHDLFGIQFAGHPGLDRLLLYEDWPEGEYPLRKDWSPEEGGEDRA